MKMFCLVDVYAKLLIIFFELRGFPNFFHKLYSSIDAMKLSKLSTRTTPASWPLSASFIAANVSAFGTSSKAALLEIGESETILTPFIRERTFFNCSNKDGLSTCNVNCAITLIFIFAAKIRVFCETTKFLVEFLIHGSILAIFGISSVFFLSHADFADIKKYTYPSLSVKISMHSCTFSKNLSILCLMLFL